MNPQAVNAPLTLSFLQKSIIDAQTQLCLDKARDWFPKHQIQPVNTKFDLRGQSAGYYYPAKNLIRYNDYIAARYFDHFVKQTVIHEVSHHIVYQITRGYRVKARAHGPEWQAIMKRFGVTPDRCHDYDVSDIPGKRQRRFTYRCACMEHQISTTRHNRIKKGHRYFCKICQTELTTDKYRTAALAIR